jgi:phosphoglycerate dehydrogenase-like enzyme
LENRAIAGAGLDTFDVEPLPPDHPFLKLSNTVITPHVGYVTQESYSAFYNGVIEDIRGFAAGEPIRVLNPDVLDSPQRRGTG